MEELEADQADAANKVESLQFELDARDKAISEAVAMIVQLEARVEELVAREQEMVRQVDASSPFRIPDHTQYDDVDRATTPKPDAQQHLARMPSFLSDHSEHTENLRNVVLANRKSFVHMRNFSDASAVASEYNRITSPSLSVLSESSFASVYGGSGGYESVSALPPAVKLLNDSPQAASSPRRRRQESTADLRNAASADARPSPDRSVNKSTVPMHSLNEVIGHSSPLPRVRKSVHQGGPRELGSPRPMSRGQGVTTPSPLRGSDSQRQHRAARAGREALQHVNTSGLLQKDQSGYANLPPTPDTIASSVLRKQPGIDASQDSLSGHFVATSQFSKPEWTNDAADGPRDVMRRSSKDVNGHLASLTAFTSGNGMPNINTDVLIASFSAAGHQLERPHSVATTFNTRARRDSWASDSDSDGGADAHSEDDLDYWMQESLKPNRPSNHSDEMAAGEIRDPSPDLFSFPANSSGWQPDQIFGALRGVGVMSPVEALKRDPLDEMSAALNTERRMPEIQQVGPNQPPPPTPHRISSLHARTGSAGGAKLQSPKKTEKSPFRSSRRFSIGGDKNRSLSMDTATQTLPPKIQPLRQHSDPSEPVRKAQYPPIAGQTTRKRINAFFRRAGSLSMAPGSLAEVAQQPPPSSPGMDALKKSSRDGRCSVPPPSPRPWPVNRQLSDAMSEDLQSATPPPILRKRVHPPLETQQHDGAGAKIDGDGGGQQEQDVGRGRTNNGGTEMNTQEDNSTPVQGKRRWLGLGRASSVKNR